MLTISQLIDVLIRGSLVQVQQGPLQSIRHIILRMPFLSIASSIKILSSTA